MMGSICQAMFVPLRLHASLYLFPILASLPLGRSGMKGHSRQHRWTIPFENDASDGKPTGSKIIMLGKMRVEQDARLAAAQQFWPPVPVIEKPAIAQILAIKVDQVDGI